MFVPNNSVNPVDMAPGIRRKTLGCGERMMLCEIVLQPGAVIPSHSHPQEQVGYVVRGAFKMVIAGEERLCGPGDSYAVPAGVEHSVEALHEEVVAIDVFAPPREEYR